MKKIFAVLALGLFLAGSALAVIDPDPNSLGIYFDQNANFYQIRSEVPMQAYLILVNPTFPAIKGLECHVGWDETFAVFLGMVLPTGGINVGDHHNVVLGLGAAMATTEATIMATYNLYPTYETTYLTLGAVQSPSIEGNLPVVVDGDDNMFQVDVSSCPDCWCAVINPPVDAQSETWGGVKSLYR